VPTQFRIVGLRVDEPGVGDELSFAISPALGRFRRIGALTLTAPHDDAVRFGGRNSGGNIWPLPPVSFY
jgi:hypothetical protein